MMNRMASDDDICLSFERREATPRASPLPPQLVAEAVELDLQLCHHLIGVDLILEGNL
jgi:hypothetical protein